MKNKPALQIQKARRAELVKAIQEKHGMNDNSLVMFIAGFESMRSAFWQESSFFYVSNITEAGAVLTIDAKHHTTLYIPHCGDVREKWVYSPIPLTQDNAKKLGVDTITVLGDQCAGYQIFPFFSAKQYSAVISRLKQLASNGGKLFTLYPHNEHEYVEQRLVLNHLVGFVPELKNHIVDISDIVAGMRQHKDMDEIGFISKAIEIAELAQEAAAQAIEPGMLECEVQASLEYMIRGSESRPSFPSIVATGKNATILHYTANNAQLKNGDLVVVDIGAVWNGYCSDLTRTYPVSGTFTARQKELYQIVLDAQQYVAEKALPGMYLKNNTYPDKSLHHLALNYFKKHGYEKYFIHGIGHYLGLDVHDVGHYDAPLSENDVFTIEPGLYIPEEGIGIRIEDDYWMAKKGCIALSENLPKSVAGVQDMVQRSLEDSESEDDFNADEDFIDEYEEESTEH